MGLFSFFRCSSLFSSFSRLCRRAVIEASSLRTGCSERVLVELKSGFLGWAKDAPDPFYGGRAVRDGLLKPPLSAQACPFHFKCTFRVAARVPQRPGCSISSDP